MFIPQDSNAISDMANFENPKTVFLQIKNHIFTKEEEEEEEENPKQKTNKQTTHTHIFKK